MSLQSLYYGHSARESTMSRSRSRDPWPDATGNYSTHISRRLHAQPERQRPYDAAAASTPACTCSRCHPALLIGNAFSKPVHVITNPPEEAPGPPLCVSNEDSPLLHGDSESLMVMRAGPLQFAPHYTNYCNALRAPHAASTCSSSLVYDREAAQTTTTSSEEVNPGGANDYTINIVTLHNIWRLTRHRTAADSGDRDSTGLESDEDEFFIIPIY